MPPTTRRQQRQQANPPNQRRNQNEQNQNRRNQTTTRRTTNNTTRTGAAGAGRQTTTRARIRAPSSSSESDIVEIVVPRSDASAQATRQGREQGNQREARQNRRQSHAAQNRRRARILSSSGESEGEEQQEEEENSQNGAERGHVSEQSSWNSSEGESEEEEESEEVQSEDESGEGNNDYWRHIELQHARFGVLDWDYPNAEFGDYVDDEFGSSGESGGESAYEEDWNSDNSGFYPRVASEQSGSESDSSSQSNSSQSSSSSNSSAEVMDTEMQRQRREAANAAEARLAGVQANQAIAPGTQRQNEREWLDDGSRSRVPNETAQPVPETSEHQDRRREREHDSDDSSDEDILMQPRSKRRRLIGVDSQANIEIEEQTESDETSKKKPVEDDEANNCCNICFEDYANTGEHRIVSLKCGHFFGRSCIERWIRSEGNKATCPNCKQKARIRDIRTHFAKSVKLVDTTELVALRESKHVLEKEKKLLMLEASKKDKHIEELKKKATEASTSGNQVPRAAPIPPIRALGNIALKWISAQLLVQTPQTGVGQPPVPTQNASARAMDFDGSSFAIGSVQLANQLFGASHGIRRMTSTFKVDKAFVPLHTNRIRLVAFSPYDTSLLLTGGEDKRVVISRFGQSKPIKVWNIPNGKQAWSGCWVSANRVAIGVSDGRVWEFDMRAESSEPIRDLTGGLGRIPIIRVIKASDSLVICSMRDVSVWQGPSESSEPGINSILLAHEADNFVKIISVAYERSTQHFAVTFAPGKRNNGITHRLYRIDFNPNGAIPAEFVEIAAVPTPYRVQDSLCQNALFAMPNGNLFSAIYNQDFQSLDVHDWNSERPSVRLPFQGGHTDSDRVMEIRAVKGAGDDEKKIVALTEKMIYIINFTLTRNCDF